MLQYQKIKKKLEYFKKYFMQNVSYILKKKTIFLIFQLFYFISTYINILKKNNIFLDIILSRYALHNLLFLHYSLVLLIKV